MPSGAVPLPGVREAMTASQIATLPEAPELGIIQAAELLNVSLAFLIKLLDEGTLPCRSEGKHRRIRREDILDYKERIDREREAMLNELVREAQENDMGYGRP